MRRQLIFRFRAFFREIFRLVLNLIQRVRVPLSIDEFLIFFGFSLGECTAALPNSTEDHRQQRWGLGL